VVDAVSGLGAVPIPQDEWGVDVVIAGSQKALMCPPGLGFASPNQKALDLAAGVTNSAYYFDWQKTLKGQKKDPPDSPFTPAVSIFMALDVALDMIESEGLENVFERHRARGAASRAAVKALGLEIFGPEDERANVVTAFKVPEGVDGGKLPKILRDKFNITANGGQNQLKGKILRIAHTGYFGAFDIITSVAAVEMALSDLGHDVEIGAGVAAAQRVFQEAGVPAGAPA
jgi:aspartate aminotransferase-like enzyme